MLATDTVRGWLRAAREEALRDCSVDSSDTCADAHVGEKTQGDGDREEETRTNVQRVSVTVRGREKLSEAAAAASGLHLLSTHSAQHATLANRAVSENLEVVCSRLRIGEGGQEGEMCGRDALVRRLALICKTLPC